MSNSAEIQKCKEDFIYFCNKYIEVTGPTGIVPLDLQTYQRWWYYALRDFRYVICKKFRQSGLGTCTLAYMLWRFLFNSEKMLVVTRSDRDACAANYTVKSMASRLPKFLRPDFKINTSHGLAVENSRIIFTGPNAMRFPKSNYIFISDAALIIDMEKLWSKLYPCLDTDGRCVVLSTPNGVGNWFHKTYQRAQSNINSFYACHFDYRDDPTKTEEWVKSVRPALGEKGWAQEALALFGDEIFDEDALILAYTERKEK